MRLTVLLFLLAHRLKRALKTSAAFRSHVGNLKVRILVRTADGRHGRVFVFDRGRFTSRRGAKHPSDAALVWSDAATAYRVMTAQEEEASFLAAAEGKLRVDGMPAFVQWFTDGVKLAV